MLLAVALCLLCTLHDSQADPGGPPGRRPLPPPHAVAEVRAVRVAQAIAVDGMLEEPVWRQAISVSHFTQSDPIEGAQPSESTVVYVAYDDAALCVAARLYDAHPDSIVARLGRQLLGRGLGGEGAHRRPWVDGGDADSVLPAALPCGRALRVGHQLPARDRAAQRDRLPRRAAEERQRVRVTLRGPRR